MKTFKLIGRGTIKGKRPKEPDAKSTELPVDSRSSTSCLARSAVTFGPVSMTPAGDSA